MAKTRKKNGKADNRKNGKLSLKPLSEQVIVITGASSGIGLATARLAAKRGAKLVLAARSANALKALEREINEEGGEAIHVVADVGTEQGVKKIADAAIKHFGGFDTWINNAGASAYGYLEDMPLEDMQKIIQTNFWGVVIGSLAAVRHLKHRGGALINVGSTLSDEAAPIMGMYSASKHAVKGFTNALRMEIKARNEPISVTLVKPGSIDTPFTVNAKNYLDSQPKHPPPVYEPHAAAVAILHCAATPVRDVYIGWGGKQQALMGQLAPRLTDFVMAKYGQSILESGMPKQSIDSNAMEHPSDRLTERGNYPGHVKSRSLYTRATLHPYLFLSMLAGAGLVATALMSGNGKQARINGARRGRIGQANREAKPRFKRLNVFGQEARTRRSEPVHIYD